MEIIETSDALFQGFLPKREEWTSKFDYGRAVLLGGSKDYGGAPLLSLSALSSLRLGAGFATLYVPEPLYGYYVGRDPQIIVQPFPSKNGNLVYQEKAVRKIMNKTTAIALGMGVTGFEETARILLHLFTSYEGYLIVDAGGLTALAMLDANYLNMAVPKIILTPHTGEFSRLIGLPREEIEKDPIRYAVEYARMHHITLILKGHESIITDGTEIYRNKTGNTGLAKAGSGDLLSGILCGIFAQHIDQSDVKKAAFGQYLLGKAADLLLNEQSEYSILAEDIIRSLPKALEPCIQK